jgi:hypothetical protein
MDEHCIWTADADGNYETTCGKTFVFVEGTPEDNAIRYCCYCGKLVDTLDPPDDDDDEEEEGDDA